MYRHLRIAVVMPAFNEARAIESAVARIPEWVDRIVVVDDASADDTAALAAPADDERIDVIRHPHNRGVGAAIVTGYRHVLHSNLDVAVVMAGDGQMDPCDLSALLDPIADDAADYVKGNRFADPNVWREMPWTRVVGNVALSVATKVTSGYLEVFDSQCGYTAIHRRALDAIDLDRLFPRYGYPNDLLARLHAARARLAQVPVKTIYGQAWRSGITIAHVVYPISFVLLRSMAWRLSKGRVTRRLPQPAGAP